MYRLRIESHFDAAHKLLGYKGKCAELHGHTWKVEVFVVGAELDDVGMVVDFEILEEKLRTIVRRLDHKLLNNITEIGNPTCENLSRHVFQTLQGLPKHVKVQKVRVWEGQKSWCEYYET